MLDNDQIRLMDMEPYRLYTICEGQGYSDYLVLFRSNKIFYYGNIWSNKGITRYSEVPGDINQYQARALACMNSAMTLQDHCDEFIDLYLLWADLSVPTPTGYSVFESNFTLPELCSLSRDERLLAFE